MFKQVLKLIPLQQNALGKLCLTSGQPALCWGLWTNEPLLSHCNCVVSGKWESWVWAFSGRRRTWAPVFPSWESALTKRAWEAWSVLFGEWVRKSITKVTYIPKPSQKFQTLNLRHVHPGCREDFRHSLFRGPQCVVSVSSSSHLWNPFPHLCSVKSSPGAGFCSPLLGLMLWYLRSPGTKWW